MLSSTSSSVKAWSAYSLTLLLFIVCLFQVCQVYHLKQELNEGDRQVNLLRRENSSSPRQLFDNDNNNILYGHMHIAKTGGTSLNGVLANKFERVCGNKGYSYDAYQSNERAKQYVEKTGLPYFLSKPDETRDRLTPGWMDEVGWEDCDYISREQGAIGWKNQYVKKWSLDYQFELHVPCRDPIDHILSQCNEIHKDIPCDMPDKELFPYLAKCVHSVQTQARFQNVVLDDFPDGVKCYDFHKQFTTYIDYMSEKLQHRRMVSEPYIQRHTNKPRKPDECILEDPELIEKVRTWLLENFDYYSFCDSCLGSENDLLLGWGAEDTY